MLPGQALLLLLSCFFWTVVITMVTKRLSVAKFACTSLLPECQAVATLMCQWSRLPQPFLDRVNRIEQVFVLIPGCLNSGYVCTAVKEFTACPHVYMSDIPHILHMTHACLQASGGYVTRPVKQVCP